MSQAARPFRARQDRREISFGCDDATRQRTLDDLAREISEFEAEYASTSGSELSMDKVSTGPTKRDYCNRGWR